VDAACPVVKDISEGDRFHHHSAQAATWTLWRDSSKFSRSGPPPTWCFLQPAGRLCDREPNLVADVHSWFLITPGGNDPPSSLNTVRARWPSVRCLSAILTVVRVATFSWLASPGSIHSLVPGKVAVRNGLLLVDNYKPPFIAQGNRASESVIARAVLSVSMQF